MTRNILVSIIIPAYNSESTIRRTLESAVRQSWRHKEVVLVDDGSTDRTIEIAESFVESHSIKIYKQQRQGACKARNVGFQKSKGDFIQYLDADDLLSTDKIKNQLELVSGDTDGVVFSSRLIRFYNDDVLPMPPSQLKFLERNWHDPVEWLINEWEGRGMGQTSIWLTPRNLIEKAGVWDERLLINQDGEFFSRVLLSSNGIRFSKDSIVYYRSGVASSVSQSSGRAKAESLLLSFQLYCRNILKVEDSPRVRRALASKFLTFIYANYDLYRDLSARANKEIEALGLQKLPPAGGRNFRLIARFLGFNNALRFRSFLRSSLNLTS